MRYLALIAIVSILCFTSGCMYSIHMVHTQGQASDIIDDDDSPDIKTDATIPLSL